MRQAQADNAPSAVRKLISRLHETADNASSAVKAKELHELYGLQSLYLVKVMVAITFFLSSL